MKGKKLYILKMGSTFYSVRKKYGDFEDWIIKGLGKDLNSNIQVINVVEGESLPKLSNCLGVIITGSHSMVTENKDWSLKVEKWIPLLLTENIPVLGICYGHQLIAKALGGYVDYHPGGEKMGSIQIKLTNNANDDKLFSSLPKRFFANVSHSQSVFSLPVNAQILAYDKSDSIYAYRIGENIWGVQFHPEFDKNIMNEYLLKSLDRVKNLERKKKILSILKSLKNTPQSSKLLKLFFSYIKKN
ncbi:MAG: glutamine amidotransferase [Melioribacter sp.]|nr:glutamine amidotransferase [Melioribacter sp.]